MVAALAPVSVPESLASPLDEAEAARNFARASKAPRTLAEYQADWRRFEAWCAHRRFKALPARPESVATYLGTMATSGKRYATIARALASICVVHKAAGFDSPRRAPIVGMALKGIARTIGTATEQKAPVLVADLRRMVAALPATMLGMRDRAVLLLGFAGAFRRSELVALDVADLTFVADGLEVTLRRSKTDQEAAGRKVGVPFGSDPATCPVRAVRAWLEAAGIEGGAVFRSMRHGRVGCRRLRGADVAAVVKRAARTAGLDADRLAGHSLRAGLATSAAKAGKSERSIMRTTGHKSAAMVRRYIRDAELFSDCAAAGIGL